MEYVSVNNIASHIYVHAWWQPACRSLVVLYVEVRVLWYTATEGSECVIITNLYEM